MLKERISFNCTGKIGGDVKELPGFFTNHAFVGVFQYDSGTPKYALELKKKKSLNLFGFCPKRLNFYGLELKVQEVNLRVLDSFQIV